MNRFLKFSFKIQVYILFVLISKLTRATNSKANIYEKKRALLIKLEKNQNHLYLQLEIKCILTVNVIFDKKINKYGGFFLPFYSISKVLDLVGLVEFIEFENYRQFIADKKRELGKFSESKKRQISVLPD